MDNQRTIDSYQTNIDNKDTDTHNEYSTKSELSSLERIAYSSVGAVSGAGLIMMGLYEPAIIIPGAISIVAFGVGGAAGGGLVDSLDSLDGDNTKRAYSALRYLAASAIIASASVLGGNYIGKINNYPQDISAFKTDSYKGLVVETRKERIPYVQRENSYDSLQSVHNNYLRNLIGGQESKREKIIIEYNRILEEIQKPLEQETQLEQ